MEKKNDKIKLIAESGSTKSDWAVVDDEGIVRTFKGEGLNPIFYNAQEIASRVGRTLMDWDGPVDEIHFYGASCSSKERCARVAEGIRAVFPEPRLHVEHDLLAAARGMLGVSPGEIAILGTGSNAGLFDGKKLTAQHGGLGYVLGDEGSGQDIGKRFIGKLMNGELPKDLESAFRQETGLSNEDISNRVYSAPLPNRFLASFSRFVKDHIGYPVCGEVVEDSLDLFIRRYILELHGGHNLPMAVVGSVGVAFHSILEQICRMEGVNLQQVAISPMEGLIKYHMKND